MILQIRFEVTIYEKPGNKKKRLKAQGTGRRIFPVS